jgi:hypothetical protein
MPNNKIYRLSSADMTSAKECVFVLAILTRATLSMDNPQAFNMLSKKLKAVSARYTLSGSLTSSNIWRLFSPRYLSGSFTERAATGADTDGGTDAEGADTTLVIGSPVTTRDFLYS